MTIDAPTELHPRETTTGDCGTCGVPWPCETARNHMLGQIASGEIQRSTLGMYLSRAMFAQQAIAPTESVEELRRRYLSWLPRGTKPHRMSAAPPRWSGR